MLADAPEMYLDEIQDWIAVTQDIGISRTALHDLIRDAGITYKMLAKAAAERGKDAREEWRMFARNNLLASMVIAVDECSKDGRTIFRKHGRAPCGQQAEIDADFVRGDRYSILAALGTGGYMGTRIVKGSVDGDEFFDFIVNDIVCFIFPSAEKILRSLPAQLPEMQPFPNDRSVLLLDNCAIHKSELLREVVEAKS